MATSSHSSRKASDTFELTTKSVEETQRLGEALGRSLLPGDVLAFIGELGSGKTTLIQGLAKGLGVDVLTVKSPTFILLREYPGRVPLIHIDAYRLDGDGAMQWLDVEWVFSRHKATVIEWADRVAGCLPEEYLELRLAHKSTNQRIIQFTAHGSRPSQIVEQVQRAAASS